MKNILKKIHAIMADVPYIQKDKSNSHQGYRYASEAIIKEKLNEAFQKHGVVWSFSVDTVATRDTTTQKGDLTTEAVITGTYTFYDTETGEWLSAKTVGVGHDKGDKGVFKAITGALKYALTTTFLIATGDDAEDDANEAHYEPVPKIADAVLDEIFGDKTPREDYIGKTCSKCGKGRMVEKKGKYGNFVSCSAYPDCKPKLPLLNKTLRLKD